MKQIKSLSTKLWRLIKTYYFKFIRTNGSPHKIALAVAIGFFVGCIVPIGVWGQTIVAILLAVKFKTNPGIAYAATWISNPYSVVIMYPVYCYVGAKIIGSSMSFSQIKVIFVNVFHNFSLHAIMNLGAQLALSYIVGAFLFAIVIGPLGYYITYLLLKKYQEKRKTGYAKRQRAAEVE